MHKSHYKFSLCLKDIIYRTRCGMSKLINKQHKYRCLLEIWPIQTVQQFQLLVAWTKDEKLDMTVVNQPFLCVLFGSKT